MADESEPVNWDKAAQSFQRMLDTHGEGIIKMADGAHYMEEAQPSPDLEQIQRLIGAASENPFHAGKAINLSLQTQRALPTLKSLQAEVEQSRTLRKELETVSGRYGEAMQEIVRLKLEVDKLREESARMKAAITKAAEEGLSR